VCAVYSYPCDRPAGEGVGARDAGGGQTPVRQAAALDLLLVQAPPAWKRCLDVLGAAAGLILLAPLLGAIALAVRATSPGPALFRQRRGGRGGRPFVLYKFRTMV